MVTIGVLALQGDVAEHVRALENSGARALLVRRVSELDQVDGLVIPGGESTTMSNLLLSFGLFDTLNDRIASGMPVYGTCAGMIMLASSILDGREDQRSFGALDMVVRRNAFGRQVDSYEEDLDVVGQAADGAAAVELAGELAPDVVLMDIRMPVLNGIDATAVLTLLRDAADRGTAVLVVSHEAEAQRFADRSYVMEDGYLRESE